MKTMKLKRTYAIEVSISKEEYEAQEGKVIEAVDELAEKLGLHVTLVETKELEKE